eukprot:Nk52_evm20s147 gene=Nk52_evmTU20s147
MDLFRESASSTRPLPENGPQVPGTKNRRSVPQWGDKNGTRRVPVVSLGEAIDSVGTGPFQTRLLFICGAQLLSDAFELMLMPLLAHAIECEQENSSNSGSSFAHVSAFQLSLLSTVVFVGMLSGALGTGLLCDHLGRRKGVLITTGSIWVCGILSAIAPNFPILVLCRFGVGFGIAGTPAALSLLTEFVPTTERGRKMIHFMLFFSIGSVLIIAIAWMVQTIDADLLQTAASSAGETMQWRLLLLIGALPAFGSFIAAWMYLPESPRYLLVRQYYQSGKKLAASMDGLEGRLDEEDEGEGEIAAKKVLEIAARMNGTRILSGTRGTIAREGEEDYEGERDGGHGGGWERYRLVLDTRGGADYEAGVWEDCNSSYSRRTQGRLRGEVGNQSAPSSSYPSSHQSEDGTSQPEASHSDWDYEDRSHSSNANTDMPLRYSPLGFRWNFCCQLMSSGASALGLGVLLGSKRRMGGGTGLSGDHGPISLRNVTLVLCLSFTLMAFAYYCLVLLTVDIIAFEEEKKHQGNATFVNVDGNRGSTNTPDQGGTDTSGKKCSRFFSTGAYLQLLVANFAEIPGLFIALYLMERIGRKRTICSLYMVAAAGTFLLGFLLNGNSAKPNKALNESLFASGDSTDDESAFQWVCAVIIVICRAAALGFNQSLWIFTTEVFPTEVRTRGLGFTTAFARIGGALSPIVEQYILKDSHTAILYLCCFTCIVAGLIILWVPYPETMGNRLVDCEGSTTSRGSRKGRGRRYSLEEDNVSQSNGVNEQLEEDVASGYLESGDEEAGLLCSSRARRN